MDKLRSVVYLISGLVLVLGAMLVPAYFRAMDAAVLRQLGLGTPSLLDSAAEQLRMDKPAAAELLVQAAIAADVPQAAATLDAVQRYAVGRPFAPAWGDGESYLRQSLGTVTTGATNARTTMDLVLPEAQRTAALRLLGTSRRADVQELLRTRQLSATALFPRVDSAAGQAMDAALLVTCLLIQGEMIQPGLRHEIEELAAAANRGYDSAPIEVVYLNITSLAKRMTWDQLTVFLRAVNDTATLRYLARRVALRPEELPVLFSALHVAGSPTAVVNYLRTFPQKGMQDLRFALGAGKGAVTQLLTHQDPVYRSAYRDRVTALPGVGWLFNLLVSLTQRSNSMGLLLKYLLWFDAALCVTRGLWRLRPAPVGPSQALEVRGIPLLRQQTLAALVVMFAISLGEPGLARNPPTPLQAAVWWFPKARPALAQVQTVPKASEPMTNEITWLVLAVFFTVQLSVYIFCLIKLREIRGQVAQDQLKLRVLDNEEVLWDAGLYIGLAGTVLTLVLLSLGIIKPSLMVAYASTCFGIVFTSILKIFHIRPYRRGLIINIETSAETS